MDSCGLKRRKKYVKHNIYACTETHNEWMAGTHGKTNVNSLLVSHIIAQYPSLSLSIAQYTLISLSIPQ